MSQEHPSGDAVGRLVRQSGGSATRLSVVERIDENGVAVTERAGRPSCCPTCGRDPSRMEVADTEFNADRGDTEITYECRCGTKVVSDARRDSSSKYYNAAPEWEAELIERGWSESELATVAPFYFIRGSEPDGELPVESYGVLAGPFGAFRTAHAVKSRFEGLGVSLSISTQEEPTAAVCRLCGKRMMRNRGGKWMNTDGEVTGFQCGNCFSSDKQGLFDAISDLHGTEVKL